MQLHCANAAYLSVVHFCSKISNYAISMQISDKYSPVIYKWPRSLYYIEFCIVQMNSTRFKGRYVSLPSRALCHLGPYKLLAMCILGPFSFSELCQSIHILHYDVQYYTVLLSNYHDYNNSSACSCMYLYTIYTKIYNTLLYTYRNRVMEFLIQCLLYIYSSCCCSKELFYIYTHISIYTHNTTLKGTGFMF